MESSPLSPSAATSCCSALYGDRLKPRSMISSMTGTLLLLTLLNASPGLSQFENAANSSLARQCSVFFEDFQLTFSQSNLRPHPGGLPLHRQSGASLSELSSRSIGGVQLLADHTLGNSSGYYLVLEQISCLSTLSNEGLAFSRPIRTEHGACLLELWYNMRPTLVGYVRVSAVDLDRNHTRLLLTISRRQNGSSSTLWEKASVFVGQLLPSERIVLALGCYPANHTDIALKSLGGIAVDDVTLRCSCEATHSVSTATTIVTEAAPSDQHHAANSSQVKTTITSSAGGSNPKRRGKHKETFSTLWLLIGIVVSIVAAFVSAFFVHRYCMKVRIQSRSVQRRPSNETQPVRSGPTSSLVYENPGSLTASSAPNAYTDNRVSSSTAIVVPYLLLQLADNRSDTIAMQHVSGAARLGHHYNVPISELGHLPSGHYKTPCIPDEEQVEEDVEPLRRTIHEGSSQVEYDVPERDNE